MNKKVVIIGGGPAGLTAAYKLSQQSVESVVLERDQVVGGLAKTVEYKGYRFDVGGHRFFTKVKAVQQMWREVLKDDFRRCRRLSRIYYNKKFFYYPLRASNALFGLGLWNSFLIVASYLYARLFPQKPVETFEQWVSNHFGKRLFRIFFKTYTEKVWGIPCSEIRAEWAAQRIKGLSLITVLKNALLKPKNADAGSVIKTLTDSFDYPRLGPGMMWQAVSEIVRKDGGRICLGAEVARILWANNRVESIEIKHSGNTELVSGTDFISSMPLTELLRKFEPTVSEEVLQAAGRLKYRDFLTVALVVDRRQIFPDNWIYIHDPGVKIGRIQNFKNWSSHMVPDPNKTCLGLEYFCFEGDGLWTKADEELINLGKRELEILGLVQARDVEDGKVVRVKKAYPVYDSTYQEALLTIRRFLSGIDNLQVVGRNGMHKYNNQDHSMLTAMLAVENILGATYDLWAVNVDQEYHEEVKIREGDATEELARLASTQPRVPMPTTKPSIADEVLIRTFARMDKLAFATAVGTVCGLGIFIASLWLVLKGGPVVGPNMRLLAQYLIGYTVTLKGAFIGMGYSFFWGFLFGWLFAYLRNLSLGLFIYFVKREAEASSMKNFLDYI